MQKEAENPRLTVDTYTRVCLTLIAVLLTVLIVGLWAERAPTATEVWGAERFLNTGAQRAALLKAQEKTNEKLDTLLRLLESGKVKVRMISEPPKKPGGRHVLLPKAK